MHRGRSALGGATVAVVAVIIVLVVGAGAYFILSSAPSSSTTTSAPTTTSPSGARLTTSSTSNTSCPSVSVPTTLNASSLITPSVTANYAQLFGNFSAMSVSLQTNSSLAVSASTPTGAVSLVSSYDVVGTSGSGAAEVYQVNVNEQLPGFNESLSASVQADGTVNSVSFAGQTMTGSEGSETFAGFMSPFTIELEEHDNLTELTSSPALQMVNQTTVTLGPSTLNVTNYEAASLPESVTECNLGVTLGSLAIQIGTLPGTSFTLVTYENLVSALQSSSGTTTSAFTLRVLSVSK